MISSLMGLTSSGHPFLAFGQAKARWALRAYLTKCTQWQDTWTSRPVREKPLGRLDAATLAPKNRAVAPEVSADSRTHGLNWPRLDRYTSLDTQAAERAKPWRNEQQPEVFKR